MIAAYDEFVDFIAPGTTPQSIIDFRPSEETKTRVADLIRQQKIDAGRHAHGFARRAWERGDSSEP